MVSTMQPGVDPGSGARHDATIVRHPRTRRSTLISSQPSEAHCTAHLRDRLGNVLKMHRLALDEAPDGDDGIHVGALDQALGAVRQLVRARDLTSYGRSGKRGAAAVPEPGWSWNLDTIASRACERMNSQRARRCCPA
jgi:hypothetical protein